MEMWQCQFDWWQSERAAEFKAKIIRYLESLMYMQQEVSVCLGVWP